MQLYIMKVDASALTDGYSPTQSTFPSEDQAVIAEEVLIVERSIVEVLKDRQTIE